MNIGIVALLILVAVIAIGFFRKLNVGVLAMAAAVILGYVSGDYTTKRLWLVTVPRFSSRCSA